MTYAKRVGHPGYGYPVTVPVARDYLRAAEIILERGWTQRVGEDSDGHLCAGGALVKAVEERTETTGFCLQTTQVAQDMNLDAVNVMVWNDRPERTMEEVVQELQATGERLLLDQVHAD